VRPRSVRAPTSLELDFCGGIRFRLTKSENGHIDIHAAGIDAPGERPGEARGMKKGFETFCTQLETEASFFLRQLFVTH